MTPARATPHAPPVRGRTRTIAHETASARPEVARLDSGAPVVDTLMRSRPTPLRRACRARGIVTHPGFEMLVRQMPVDLSFFDYDPVAQTVDADPSDVLALLASQ